MFEWVEFSDKYDSYRVTTLQLYIAMNIVIMLLVFSWKKNVFCFFFKKTCFFFKKNTVEKKQGSKWVFFKTTCFQDKYSQFVTVC